jgi:deoxyribonuclease IV
VLFGAQVRQAGGLLAALRRAEAMGAEVMQVFAQSPRQWRYPEANAERAEAFGVAWPVSAVVRRVVCHAPYLINLGSADPVVYERSCACLAENLRAASAMGAAGLVVHLGSHLGAGLDARLDAVAAGLVAALEQADCHLLLENTAGAGGTIGRSFDELARVIDAAGSHPRLGVCLDTQHAWAAGMSFETVDDAGALVTEIDRTVGLDRLACLHVNDSKVPRGAGLDRHENVGQGAIGPAAFRSLLGHPALQGLPAVLEVPGTENPGPERPSKRGGGPERPSKRGGGPDARELATVRQLHAEGLLLTRSRSPRPSQSPRARGSGRSRGRS